MKTTGRNRYCLAIEVEFDLPIAQPHAQSAADLLAHDLGNWLSNNDWGWGRARVTGTYAPQAQFEYGDFDPDSIAEVVKSGGDAT